MDTAAGLGVSHVYRNLKIKYSHRLPSFILATITIIPNFIILVNNDSSLYFKWNNRHYFDPLDKLVILGEIMKYHFMRVSPTSVRIELIPENTAEKDLLQQLALSGSADPALSVLFEKAMQLYQADTVLLSKNFMEFPRVALCTYQLVTNLAKASL
jgi:hypothetical protein